MKFGITKWEPFKDMVSLRDEIDNLFNDFFRKTPDERMDLHDIWYPALDIEESNDRIKVIAEAPGMKKEEIKLTVSEGQLIIQGERKFEKEEKDKTYHRIERSYGKFRRTISLPKDLEVDKAKATYEQGILKVDIPKSKKTKPKEIDITVK
jgi:HSP20 family protein